MPSGPDRKRKSGRRPAAPPPGPRKSFMPRQDHYKPLGAHGEGLQQVVRVGWSDGIWGGISRARLGCACGADLGIFDPKRVKYTSTCVQGLAWSHDSLMPFISIKYCDILPCYVGCLW